MRSAMTRSIVCTTSHDGQPVPYPTRAFDKSLPLPVISPGISSSGSIRVSSKSGFISSSSSLSSSSSSNFLLLWCTLALLRSSYFWSL
jgi:hypothetical protein